MDWTNGKLTRVRRGSASQPGSEYKDCTFTYDGYGRRIRKHYIYDPNPAVAGDGNYYYEINYEYDESGRLIREFCTTHYDNQTESTREFVFLYDESGIIGTMYSLNGAELQPYYYRRNAQGDVTAIYDADGNRKAEYAYDAFGNCTVLYSGITDLANNNPIRYRGYYYDKETKLYYLNSRYYNPEWRRFISPDSTDYLDPESINGLNLYAYCNNDPVNYVDPSGHSAFLIATTIIGTLIGLGIAAYKDYQDDAKINVSIGWKTYLGYGLTGGALGFGIGYFGPSIISSFGGSSLLGSHVLATGEIAYATYYTAQIFGGALAVELGIALFAKGSGPRLGHNQHEKQMWNEAKRLRNIKDKDLARRIHDKLKRYPYPETLDDLLNIIDDLLIKFRRR